MAENIFGVVEKLADSNSNWIKTSHELMIGLVKGIEQHLDDVENIFKNVDKSDCDISDLQNIYSLGLNDFEEIINLMSKINSTSKAEVELQKKMLEKACQEYKDILEIQKYRDPNSEI